ncbi:MAG TPA: pinensin family lanthipeptide [Longimicrobium sp.]|nr:pinensin family lanthipeptide [Longimicrobium sp.]
MRKLTLQLEDLSVESFVTAADHTGRGTAHAHAATLDNVAIGVAPLPEETRDVFCTGETCRGLCPRTGAADAGLASYPGLY